MSPAGPPQTLGAQTSVFVGCSLMPFPLTVDGYTDLAALLGELRGRVSESLTHEIRIPEVSTWLVTQWHYGRDGRNEVSGPKFNMIFGCLGQAVVSAYTKDLNGKTTLRIERKECPRKPLPEAFLEKLEAP